MSTEAIIRVSDPISGTGIKTRSGHGKDRDIDRDNNVVSYMVIHIANPMVKDI